MNNLAPMKNVLGGVQGNLNWMPGYMHLTLSFCIDLLFSYKEKCLPQNFMLLS